MNTTEDHKNHIGTDCSTFFQRLRKEKEIRFIMDHSNNYGNQASCIHIIKRIISLIDSEIAVNLVYTGGEKTVEKLKLFLKGFSSPSETLRIGKSTVHFLEWKEGKDELFEEECLYGFTGGFDSSRQDLTKVLNVRYFLHLSLQGWLVQEKIDIKDGETCFLSGENGIDPHLIDRAYYYENPEITDDKWMCYKEHGTETEKQRVSQTQCLLDFLKKEKWELCPSFSIRLRGGQISIEPEEILTNLIASVLHAQETKDKPLNKTVILLLEHERNMSKDCLNKVQEFVAGIPCMESFFQIIERQMLHAIKGKSNPSGNEALLVNDLKRRVKRVQSFYKKLPAISAYLETLSDGGKRVHYLSGEDIRHNENLRKELRKFQEDPHARVLLFSLYNVPPEIFHYIYSQATLPSVFEGQTTASQILNIGKPYFQLNRMALFDEDELFKAVRYPTQFLPEKYEKTAKECREISNHLHNAFAEEDYKKSIHKISDFTVKTKMPNSHFNEYFEAAKGVYGDPLNDKLLLGCMHLAKISGLTNSEYKGF